MKAFVKSSMVAWARERSGESVDALAKKLTVSTDRLLSWERGEDYPSFIQAQTLAKKTHIPFGWLYLDVPPKDSVPIPDLRTVRDDMPHDLSPEFKELLNDIYYKMDEYTELIIEDGAEALPFVGKYTAKDRPEIVAADIAETLGIDEEMWMQASNADGLFRDIVHRADAHGILIMRSSIVGSNTHRSLNVDEFRGFAISDVYSPLVFINSKDASVAQIFTLAHELAHLWIGESGVSNDIMRAKKAARPIEAFCNRVAEELLAPEAEFKSRWSITATFDQNITLLLRHFRVSKMVLLYRAFNLGFLTERDFNRLMSQEMRLSAERVRKQRQRSSGGPKKEVSIPARNSHILATTVVHKAAEGRIPYADACSILGVKKVAAVQSLAKSMGSW